MLLVGVLALTFGSCGDDFTAPPGLSGKTIAATMAADPNFTLWTAVIQRVGIYPSLNNNNSGIVTIFGPSDPALTAFLGATYSAQLASLQPVTEASLVTFIEGLSSTSNPTLASFTSTMVPIVNYHMVSSKLTSSMITGTQTFATFQGARLSISKTATAVYLNGNSASNGAQVTNFDLLGSNGVAHTIDRVMSAVSSATVLTPLGLSINYGTNPVTITGGTASDATDSDFDMLAALIRYTGMVDDLVPNASPLPDFTLFQANDGLMRAYLTATYPAATLGGLETEWYTYISTLTPTSGTTPSLDQLTALVQYGVVPGRFLTQDLSNGQQLSTYTAGTGTAAAITVSIAPGPPAVFTLQDLNAGTDAVITTANILTNSGVLHTVNQVVKPN